MNRKEEIMAGKHGRKKPTHKKSENSTRARENVAPVVEEHVEEQSDENNSDDLSPDLCQPSEEIKGRKRKNPSSISGGVSTRTRARKAVSDGNEPVGEDVVHEESTRREKTAVSLSLDSKVKTCLLYHLRMSELERNQRLLRKRAKKIEVRLTSIESKENEAEENNYGEDMDFGQWDNMDCGRPKGWIKRLLRKNYDRAKGKDKDTRSKRSSSSVKMVRKRLRKSKRRVQDGEKEGEKEPKETPTPPRGRTKAAAARKLVHSTPEKFFQFARPREGEELKLIHGRYKGSEEESPTKEAATPAKKKAKAEKKKVDGAPKKRGRPKKTAATLKPCTPLPEKRKGTLLARIIDEEQSIIEGSASDTWNHWLVVKEKKIWWKELYEQDTGARVFTKQKDKEKVTFVGGSSSNSGLESSLNGLEERILAFMDKEFSGLLSSVETKLEVMDCRMSELERNQRLLRKRAKKIEVRLTSIESKENEAEENNYGEDMDFGQWDNMDCGRPEGLDKTAAEENYDRAKGKDKDTGEEENEESTTEKKEEAEQETEQEAEEEQKAEEEQGKEVQEKQQPREDGEKEAEEEQEKRVQDGEKEGEKEPKETPTPPRGRTKAAAARKLVHSTPEKFFQFARPREGEELARLKERCAVQAEKLWREIEEEEILESPDEEEVEKPQENTEKSDENPVESPAEEEVEKTQENAEELVAEPEKQWKSEEESPTKEAATPAKKKAKAEKKKVDGAPKKRGRPKKTAATLKPCTPEKRKGEPSRCSPFNRGKDR
ncbi:hypothetical protein Bca52824_057559 [Brassica carinata]|uniref:Uncharacterized protein n=1 Tax=Brassica carinata TaxID=52824 RepID=A0A8X7QXL7_BRACI|nr:hypothetical protein Bca52824_057559 [Brassica carinata]